MSSQKPDNFYDKYRKYKMKYTSYKKMLEKNIQFGGSIEELIQSELLYWQYKAEGRLNLVCTYTGTNTGLIGKVIRIQKDVKGHHKTSCDHGLFPMESIEFVNASIKPILTESYLGNFVSYKVSQVFLDSLFTQIYNLRPESRRVESTGFNVDNVVVLMDDFTKLYPSMFLGIMGDGVSKTFSFEIKPKSSVVVCNKNGINYDRFTVQQIVKNTNSHYKPSELFSRDISKIRSAIVGLTETPQNNFKMFIDGNVEFTQNKTTIDYVLLLSDKIREHHDGFTYNDIVNILTDILFREQILHLLHIGQSKGQNVGLVLDILFSIVCDGLNKPEYKPNDAVCNIIRDFLISLTLKDCSLILSFIVINTRLPSITCNETNKYGIMSYKDETILYTIKAVDIDPKSITRIPSYKYEEDELIRKLKN